MSKRSRTRALKHRRLEVLRVRRVAGAVSDLTIKRWADDFAIATKEVVERMRALNQAMTSNLEPVRRVVLITPRPAGKRSAAVVASLFNLSKVPR